MLLHDRATIEGKARITREGYLVADAYVAMANNIQEYHAAELGLTDRAATDVVRVFRPESEVFAVDSIASASRLPITLKHPTGIVDAKNWRDLAKGETGEEIMRDGDRMRVPLRVTDAGGVTAVQTDHSEFSMGYSAELKMEAGVHDGKPYDATLSSIRYNHLAAVPVARGGPSLRIVDERTIPQAGESSMKTLVIDGLTVDMANADAAIATVQTLISARDAANGKVAGLETQIATLTTDAATKDAEIVTLKKQIEDSKITPAQMRDAAKAYASTVNKAKQLGVTVSDEMDEAGIMKAVVSAKVGDAAKEWNDAQVAASFGTLTAGLKDAQVDPLRQVISDGVLNIGDAAKAANDARAARYARFASAHNATAA